MSNRYPGQGQVPELRAVPPPTLGERLEAIEEKIDALLRGQADLTVAFGRLHRKVKELERDSKWKVWVVRVTKTVVPVALGAAAARWPWLSGLISGTTPGP